nr:PREDICTED: LOW QUALITY PROTEIN: AT-rich interactive domain-containing protein 5A [Anolis carolinensis]|eukprot:XP_016854701.1 PREDICTED: LOW QUALITY PROTEIN: AT-rich interactive domain-containing protein 5A [Anolis carolinensis]
MAPSFKGKRKKKPVPTMEGENPTVLDPSPEEDVAAGSPCTSEEQQNFSGTLGDAVSEESPPSKPENASESERKSPAEESGDETVPSSEKEEEQTFLVNLYRFMKDRHTPIERVPHLGFKQINLFKIYKVVEKMGAYELVTGRRLWKNVYDMLGGSPGSTSAATCTRRHYERLVLPYVRHLKGEDDKPLPPVKPRKQYKVSKEPKGERGSEKKRAKKEKVLQEKLKTDVVVASSGNSSNCIDQSQEKTEGRSAPANGRETSESEPRDCNCRGSGSSEAYKRLFSSFYFKGNHGIMSPLAKKKLLAQVSKDEALCRHLSDCPQYKKPWVHEVPALSPEAATMTHTERSNHRVEDLKGSGTPNGSSQLLKENGGVSKVSPTIRTSQKVDDGSSRGHPSPSFRGSFYTSRSDIVKPVSCHPIRGPYFTTLRELSEAPYLPSVQKRSDGSEEQPEDLRKRPSLSSWRSDSQQPSAFQPSSQRGSSFAPNKTSWVTNLAKVNPQVSKPSGASLPPSLVQKKRALEEDVLRHGKKLKAVSPFVADTESPNGQQGLAKAAVANPCFSAPRAPEMYKGTMLRLPVNFDNAGDRSKGQPPSLIPSLSVSPFLIPAFPTPILTASLQPSDLCHPVASGLIHYPTSYDGAMRQRLYPVSTWHSQPAYATSHIPAYHRNTKL